MRLIKKVTFDFSSKTEPLEHQIEATDYVSTHNDVPLFDEQGLGKSKIVIDALCRNMKEKTIDGALIICKKSLLYMWKDEIEKHSNLLPVVLDGSRMQRGRMLTTYGHFYIANYESLIQETEFIELLLRQRRFAMVLDESQKMKNPKSKTARAVISLRSLVAKRIIITGTPIANRPEDLWSQFYFLDGGVLLGDDFDAFQKRFKVDLKGAQDMSQFELSLKSLRETLRPVSIRRTKDVLELPEKTFENVTAELAPKQRIAYDKARSELYYEISNSDGEKIEEEIDNYLVKLLRLTQIASNPGLLNIQYNEEPGKFKVLNRLVRDVVERKEKAILWTSFIGNIRTLRNRFKEFGAQMLFGEIPIMDRLNIVKKFMNEERCKLLIANPAAAKEGLTLTSANNAIYVDRTFKMDDYLQSQDRIHRITQTKPCKVFKIIAKDTIDEYTDEILEKKELIAKYTLGDTECITFKRSYLSKADLLRILGG
ncbi:MAG: DEAD/DEAH box helicase [Candidatus Atabeyarchaeum deiterrae]